MNKPIHIFVRQNNNSFNRKLNVRPTWFSHQTCFDSLITENVDITVCLDGTLENHHVDFRGHEVIEFKGGSDPASFLFLLETVESKNLDDDKIVYLVEDDYLHRPGWDEIMVEAFTAFEVDYATLYDHADKYFFEMYETLQSKILHSKSVHWRTTPSTCSTYAGKMKTFRKHWETHVKYCLPGITHGGYDHTKFLDLWEQGSNLISCIPGYSTHSENPYVSPVIDWGEVANAIKHQ